MSKFTCKITALYFYDGARDKLNQIPLNRLLSHVNPYDLNQIVTSEINFVVGAVVPKYQWFNM